MGFTLLRRHLNGENKVVGIAEFAKFCPSVEDFPKFLRDVGLGTYEGLLEIAQVLKVPYEELLDCNLVDENAQENIREYVLSGRISPRCLEFMRAQHGKAGTKNWPPRDENPEDHHDPCG
ncbi:MAG: hypothetical protein WCJ74_00230 [bacterium]